jgi:putative endonuclease
MAGHNILGRSGEAYAAGYLREKGYRILETNWRYGKEEIDIVALQGGEVVFVEVKTRSFNPVEAPELSVTEAKQKYLINAAEAYIRQHSIDHEARFDIVSLVESKGGFGVHHIEDAFRPGWHPY